MKRGNSRPINNIQRGKAVAKPTAKVAFPKKVTMVGAYENLASLINEYENINDPLIGFSQPQIYQKLYDAIIKRDLELLRSYINFHKEEIVQAFLKTEPKSLFHLAIKSGVIEMVESILRLNIPVNILNKNLKTAMHKAWKNLNIVKLLIQHNADINPRDKKGKVPLHYAILSLSGDELAELVALGFDLHIKDNDGNMPIDLIQNQDLKAFLLNKYFWQKSKGLLFVSKFRPNFFVGTLNINLRREILDYL
ncbi:unnamed protein product [Blepharisma stoltei]|uniref:Ankyrin repeat domain-containing protein n=1 Tax=Blepharisma stoltei TaxID=1481888 RepID=A0AAU9IYY6_9CILI|nr:unnamed protein product [Blepharisma stoltei]